MGVGPFGETGHGVWKLAQCPEWVNPQYLAKRPVQAIHAACVRKNWMETNKMEANKNVDRRVLRTQAALQRAFLALMQEKGYAAVTVEDICREANVGRSTFYAHFTSKDDLNRAVHDDTLRRQLLDRQLRAHAEGGAKEAAFCFALDLIEHAGDHLDLYRALVAKGGSEVTLSMMRSMLVELVRIELALQNGKAADAQARELAVQFTVGGLLAMLIFWLDNGAKVPAGKIDALFRRLVANGIMEDETNA